MGLDEERTRIFYFFFRGNHSYSRSLPLHTPLNAGPYREHTGRANPQARALGSLRSRSLVQPYLGDGEVLHQHLVNRRSPERHTSISPLTQVPLGTVH